MATMDIREPEEQEITRIDFANNTNESQAYFLTKSTQVNSWIESDSGVLRIRNSDIPNLIKALQKAQELWGE